MHDVESSEARPIPSPPRGGGLGWGGVPLLDLLQITDRSFPTGSYVHSQGLEWLLKHADLALDEIIRLRLQQQLARFELIFLHHAYLIAQEATDSSLPPARVPSLPFPPARVPSLPLPPARGRVRVGGRLPGGVSAGALDEQYHAFMLSREARQASMQMGRQLLRNAADLFHTPALIEAAEGLPYAHHAVGFGLIGREVGIPAAIMAEAYAFQAMRGQVSAAQRLTRLGQVEAQRLLHRIKGDIHLAVETALQLTLDDAASFAPILEIGAMAHERSEVRLFVS